MHSLTRAIWQMILIGSFFARMVSEGFAQPADFATTNVELKTLLHSLKVYDSLRYKGLAWDDKGTLIEARIGYTNLTDSNLFLLSQIDSLQTLWIQGYGRRDYVSPEGMAALKHLTNLTELHVACFFKMKPGFTEEISLLKSLKRLDLYYAFPLQEKDYSLLSQLPNLQELHINGDTNLGPQEVLVLTNLTSLRSLSICRNTALKEVSKTGTNFLSSFSFLTNAHIEFPTR